MHYAINVNVSVQPEDIIHWLSPFRKGARVRCRTGEKLSDILLRQFGMKPDYVEKRVRTVFINGCPVDDLDAAVVADGDEVALAGALPGLVGICMGRNSPVAGFRRDITFHSGEAVRGQGVVVLKLFNTVGQEAGPLLLSRGILLTGAELGALAGRAMAEGHKPLAVTLEGKPVGLDALCGLKPQDETELRVAVS
ncbi:hypothetical protein [Paucidesulfovibrio longus]|uniref:hypothetical protein n=1 Tax=Paucidesulfovibrio longus TaxID=889 RepID=UPI0003B57233|nr:hypothetical protein [Paucidesulfovibrio longus]